MENTLHGGNMHRKRSAGFAHVVSGVILCVGKSLWALLGVAVFRLGFCAELVWM